MDTSLAQSLLLLTAFLPDPAATSSFDKNPPAELLSLFRISFLFDQVTALVRNGAISDITQRSQLYQTVFAFITAVAKHPGLVQVIMEKRPGKKQYPGLQKLYDTPQSGQS